MRAAPKARKRPRKRSEKAKSSKLDDAKKYELAGRRALLNSDYVVAERYLKLCLKTAEYAPCHGQLGIVYAKTDENKLSVTHYQRYIELWPDAADAKTVKLMIDEALGR